MTQYELSVLHQLKTWQHKMQKPPSAFDRLSKKLQVRMNKFIPERVHQTITTVIKQMMRGVLFGAEALTRPPVLEPLPFEERERRVFARIDLYRKAGAAEGGVTGAGGILLGLADFPILIGLKIKLLFEIAALYGYSVNDYRERLFIMHIFQLAFSGPERRREVYEQLKDWQERSRHLPDDIHQFDWRTFQQEYRDYIDLAKMAQLIPGIGAAVGLVVNYRLMDALGKTAMNAYRMRWVKEQLPQQLES
jgi:hypothetical protein